MALLKKINNAILLAATPIGNTATSAVYSATGRIFLICVHGFTFRPHPKPSPSFDYALDFGNSKLAGY